MRLSPLAIQAIRAAALRYFGEQARVWLFGSRVDNSAKGGDIDLYVESPQALDNAVERAGRMSAAIQMALGEQKIDIVVAHPGSPRQRIHDIAKQTGVLL
jgi:predicted nucleotidyltransferase